MAAPMKSPAPMTATEALRGLSNTAGSFDVSFVSKLAAEWV
jgi:hypothetical protein